MTRTRRPRLMVLAVLLVTFALALSACGGSQPAAKPAAPAAPAFDKLIIAADVVRGATNVTDDKRAELVCVQASRYARNERVVWRIKVLDPKTGAFLTDAEVGQVDVKLQDGQVFAAKYGPHGKAPDPVENFWTAGWTIPANYPSGTTNFNINVAAKDGRSGMFVPDFKVPAAFLTVLDKAVPVLPPPPAKK